MNDKNIARQFANQPDFKELEHFAHLHKEFEPVRDRSTVYILYDIKPNS